MILFQSEIPRVAYKFWGNSGHFKTHKVPLDAAA